MFTLSLDDYLRLGRSHQEAEMFSLKRLDVLDSVLTNYNPQMLLRWGLELHASLAEASPHLFVCVYS